MKRRMGEWREWREDSTRRDEEKNQQGAMKTMERESANEEKNQQGAMDRDRSMKRTGRSQSSSPPSANARIVVIPLENEATSAAAPPPLLRRGDFRARVKKEPEKEPKKERGDFLARVKKEPEKEPEKDDFVEKDKAEKLSLFPKSKPRAKPALQKDGTYRTYEARGPVTHLSWMRGLPSDFIPIGPLPSNG